MTRSATVRLDQSLPGMRSQIMIFSSLLRVSAKNLERPVGSTRFVHLSPPRMVKIGEALPNAELAEGNPANKVNVSDLCKDKRVIIFGVPGAFTPGCSKTHLPGYVKNAKMLKDRGYDEVVCVSVNDAFVMDAWGKEQKVEGKIRMLADADASFTRALNLHINVVPLGGVRSKRYSMIVENCVIKKLNVEPDGTGLSCSLAEKLLI